MKFNRSIRLEKVNLRGFFYLVHNFLTSPESLTTFLQSLFSSSASSFSLSLQDKMIFHVCRERFLPPLRYHDDSARLLWWKRRAAGEKFLLRFAHIIFSPSQSGARRRQSLAFSNIIQLHVIFINHNSIYVYVGFWIIQSKFHLVDGVDELFICEHFSKQGGKHRQTLHNVFKTRYTKFPSLKCRMEEKFPCYSPLKKYL